MLPVLDVYVRPMAGKSHSKKDRKSGLVPAVIYDSEHNCVHLHQEQILWFLKKYGDSGLVELKIGEETIPVLIKEVQRHPISGELLHVDFKPVTSNKNIFTKVPINFVNSNNVSRKGGVIQTQKSDLEIECQVKNIPRSINVDMSKHNVGTTLKVKDIEVSEEISIINNPEDVVAIISFIFKDN